MKYNRQYFRFFIFALTLWITPLFANIKLPSVIGDNMVLQQQFEAPIWGWAEPGTEVRVSGSWDNQAATTKTDPHGKWLVKLGTPKAGGPFTLSINELEIKNVLIGEVWICSGQSNMQWSVSQSINSEAEIAAGNYPDIRLFYVARQFSDEPKQNCYGNWTACSPTTVSGFSAAAYFFGRKLQQDLGVPIGLIHTSWGGTPAEAWTRKEILESDTDLKIYLERFAEKIVQAKPGILPRNKNSASGLYNAMLAPLIPYGIQGAIWYQGESNRNDAKLYEKLFPAMIKNWRDDWKQGNFPFYFVQIAPYKYREPLAGAALRDAQRKTLSVSNTGMVVTLDIGNPNDIHPKNKQAVGQRLALWALAKNYGRNNIACSGPLYQSMKVEGSKIRLFFTQAKGGIVAKDGELSHFEIAGKDQLFHPAKAQIDGETVVVSGKAVDSPIAVRFAFHNTDEPNFFNREGLPASSFRTDDWLIINEQVIIQGNFDPANDEFVFTMRCEKNPLEIRYTTDGTEPTESSRLYSDTLRFKNSSHLKARAFRNNRPSLMLSEQKWVRHLATGKNISLAHKYSSKYTAGGNRGLLNSRQGSTNLRDGAWQGFQKDDLAAVIDLGELITVRKISAGFLQIINSWLFFPSSVKFAVSTNGKSFKPVANLINDVPAGAPGELIKIFEQEFQPVKVRYIQVHAKNLGVCPAWHPGAGEKTWLFVDEIIIE